MKLIGELAHNQTVHQMATTDGREKGQDLYAHVTQDLPSPQAQVSGHVEHAFAGCQVPGGPLLSLMEPHETSIL